MNREFVFNATRMKRRRRALRKRPTKFEGLLWEQIRNRKLGCKFKRQYSLGNFVADFFCKEKKLAIEVEGEIHKRKDVREYDKYRNKYFETLGVRMVAVKNDEIESNLNLVLNKIINNLTSNPSPESGEGNERGEVQA